MAVRNRFKGLDLIECLKNYIKFCLKSGFSSTRTMNFQMFKLDLEKAEEPEIKFPATTGSSKKARAFQKNIYYCFFDYAKAFDCVNHNKLQKTLQFSSVQLLSRVQLFATP